MRSYHWAFQDIKQGAREALIILHRPLATASTLYQLQNTGNWHFKLSLCNLDVLLLLYFMSLEAVFGWVDIDICWLTVYPK